MTIFKKLFILSISAFILSLPVLSYPCAWSEPVPSHYNFLDPTITGANKYEPFNFTETEKFYSYKWETPKFNRINNLKEWRNYFRRSVKPSDIHYFVYQSTIDELNRLLTAIRGKSERFLSGNLVTNSVAKFLIIKEWTEPVYYLIYAKECEPHTIKGNTHYWESPPKKNLKEIDTLITNGIKNYNITKNRWLKLRYAYQIIRLAHYSGQYQRTIELYDKLVGEAGHVHSIIYYWAMGHKAGALKRLKHYPEAAYLFSIVFNHSKSKRIPAYHSFLIRNDNEWNQVMKMCRTNDERITLFFLRGIKPFNNALEEMKNIAQLNPRSDKLTFLMFREINKLEHRLLKTDLKHNHMIKQVGQFPLDSTDKTHYDSVKPEDIAYLNEFQQFIDTKVNEGKVSSIHLWNLGSAYLDLIAGRFSQANSKLNTLYNIRIPSSVKHQINLLKLVMEISQLTQLSENEEHRIYHNVKSYFNNKRIQESLSGFMINVFQKLYLKQQEYGKAFLCHNSMDDLFRHPTYERVNDIINLLDKKNKTAFEIFLIDKLSKENDLRNMLLEIKGTVLLGQDNLKLAIDIYQSIPESFRKNYSRFHLSKNPFSYKINEVKWEPTESVIPFSGNKLDLAQKLYQLKMGLSRSENQAQDAFILGLAYYNMTYFGNSWNAIDYFKSIVTFKTESYDIVYNDTTKALAYFNQAIQLARDPELAAKATFMAAECEQKQNLISKTDSTHYFSQMKSKYSSTQFYQKALNGCSDFYGYVGN